MSKSLFRRLQEYSPKLTPVEQLSIREKYPHYFVDVRGLDYIDVYWVIRLFRITDPEIAHAVKKMLVNGLRGVKDNEQDIRETIDALNRWLEIREENNKRNK